MHTRKTILTYIHVHIYSSSKCNRHVKHAYSPFAVQHTKHFSKARKNSKTRCTQNPEQIHTFIIVWYFSTQNKVQATQLPVETSSSKLCIFLLFCFMKMSVFSFSRGENKSRGVTVHTDRQTDRNTDRQTHTHIGRNAYHIRVDFPWEHNHIYIHVCMYVCYLS